MAFVTIAGMKLRFKLKTLFIATALVGLFLGLQIYVHNKAKRTLNEDWNSGHDDTILSASVLPISFADIVGMERRCEIVFERTDGQNYVVTIALKYQVRLIDGINVYEREGTAQKITTRR